jgi:hypothetical protein
MLRLHENLSLDGTDDELRSLYLPLIEGLPIPAFLSTNQPRGPVKYICVNSLYRKLFGDD